MADLRAEFFNPRFPNTEGLVSEQGHPAWKPSEVRHAKDGVSCRAAGLVPRLREPITTAGVSGVGAGCGSLVTFWPPRKPNKLTRRPPGRDPAKATYELELPTYFNT